MNVEEAFQKHKNLIWLVINKQFKNAHLDADDMFQVGSIALLTAIENYRPGTYKFSTYATVVIRNAILTELRRFTRKKRKCENGTVSINALLDKQDETLSYDNLMGEESFEDDLISKFEVEEMLEKLTKKQKEAVIVMMQTFNQQQAAKILNIAQPSLNERLVGARRRLNFAI